ncbi:uncharacterized protein M6B38_250000 [Iris pallida]|uniref:Chorein N-terminal domain-containing protein n=1 Tax=Iris pallida TaxID=29817 RepID=A0AAX6EMI2_IRIPA|nr:uncharacterized protein M6B38_179040 [Iris pallida]KAJ6853379.1 uncharacterized protein M6B38_250000 [Iris pallida]
MESIIARALEYTLKYWLKSFSRDQFKLQGRTAQLSNLDLNGDALHASIGLPPALNVTTARVGKLEITLPAVSYVQVEPIVVQIDRLDVVLEENSDTDIARSSSSAQSSTSSAKGSGYGFADKIADGMTLEVGTVNLLIETRGGAGSQGGATWSSPLASITIRNLLLYTTNENWQVVSLKEARDFSNNRKCIYVFKKLEWQSLSVDLLPHPDMFTDSCLTSFSNGSNRRGDDGAKRLFFGGERFLEGISGQANITVQRTELNSPLGLEVQLHIPEAVCPALSEPGLRALLRFMTGFFVCLNRGDVDPKAQQRCTEAAGLSLVSVIVDHIFLCIKDAEFRLELLMQSLHFSRASVSDGEITKNLSCIMVGGLFLRDTFSHPPCSLVQPSMFSAAKEPLQTPEFGENFCPPIYPLGDKHCQFNFGVPLICLHSLQIKPSPAAPTFASQTVVNCQPLTIILQEESCLRISSFLADGIAVNPGDVLPDYSVNSFQFTLKEFDLTVPLNAGQTETFTAIGDMHPHNLFSGARLHVEDLYFSQSPALKCMLLNLDKDAACFSLWEHQPVDASQRKWTMRASHLSLSLETDSESKEQKGSTDWSAGLWRCVELHEACFEAAMITADGGPLLHVPPPEGIVRLGVACRQFSSNTSVEQMFFVLDLYAYFGEVSEKIRKVSKNNGHRCEESFGKKIMEKIPCDSAVSLAVNSLHLKFLDSSSVNIQGMPLVKFSGEDLFLKVSHRTLGGAFAVSTTLHWETVCVDCVDGEGVLPHENDISLPGDLAVENGYPQMRAVLWIEKRAKFQKKPVPFLEISAVHVMPYDVQDMECHSLNVSAKISGVRLGGGMNYTEALLHRFGILGPDGGPGEELSKGLKNLSSGPLAKLFKASPLMEVDQEEEGCLEEDSINLLDLGMPDDVDITIELKNWLFALEGTQEMQERWTTCIGDDVSREERCWHTTFESLLVKAKSSPHNLTSKEKLSTAQKFPVELVTVGVEGWQALKPRFKKKFVQADSRGRGNNEVGSDKKIIETDSVEGVNVEVRLVLPEEEGDELTKWMVESVKFSVKQPIEATALREELEYLAILCRSEVDSMGRIAAGILRLLKIDGSIGQATMDQLSNIGSEGLDKVFTPGKLSRGSSINSFSGTPSFSAAIAESATHSLETTLSSLEAEVSESQGKCSSLLSELSTSEFSGSVVKNMKQLNQKLESIQLLLSRLRGMDLAQGDYI